MAAPAGANQAVGANALTAWKIGTKPVTAAYIGATQVA